MVLEEKGVILGEITEITSQIVSGKKYRITFAVPSKNLGGRTRYAIVEGICKPWRNYR